MKTLLVVLAMLVPVCVLGGHQTLTLGVIDRQDGLIDVEVVHDSGVDSTTAGQVVLSYNDEVLEFERVRTSLPDYWIQYVNPEYPHVSGEGNNRSVSFQVYGGAARWYQGEQQVALVLFEKHVGYSNLTVMPDQVRGGGTQFVQFNLTTNAVYYGNLDVVNTHVGVETAVRGVTWSGIKGLFR